MAWNGREGDGMAWHGMGWDGVACMKSYIIYIIYPYVCVHTFIIYIYTHIQIYSSIQLPRQVRNYLTIPEYHSTEPGIRKQDMP